LLDLITTNLLTWRLADFTCTVITIERTCPLLSTSQTFFFKTYTKIQRNLAHEKSCLISYTTIAPFTDESYQATNMAPQTKKDKSSPVSKKAQTDLQSSNGNNDAAKSDVPEARAQLIEWLKDAKQVPYEKIEEANERTTYADFEDIASEGSQKK
jgi:hypothetical protein